MTRLRCPPPRSDGVHVVVVYVAVALPRRLLYSRQTPQEQLLHRLGSSLRQLRQVADVLAVFADAVVPRRHHSWIATRELLRRRRSAPRCPMRHRLMSVLRVHRHHRHRQHARAHDPGGDYGDRHVADDGEAVPPHLRLQRPQTLRHRSRSRNSSRADRTLRRAPPPRLLRFPNCSRQSWHRQRWRQPRTTRSHLARTISPLFRWVIRVPVRRGGCSSGFFSSAWALDQLIVPELRVALARSCSLPAELALRVALVLVPPFVVLAQPFVPHQVPVSRRVRLQHPATQQGTSSDFLGPGSTYRGL